MKPMIEFKKQRELGDIISDTFKFLRQEFKPFTKAVFTIAGPFMVLYLLAMVFYMYMIGDLFTFGNAANFQSLGLFFVTIGVFFICLILVYVFANAAALHYIKSYIRNNGKVDLNEVRTQANRGFVFSHGPGGIILNKS